MPLKVEKGLEGPPRPHKPIERGPEREAGFRGLWDARCWGGHGLGQRGQATWEGGHLVDPLRREGASLSQAHPMGERPNGHERAGPLEGDRKKGSQTGRLWKPRRQTGGLGSNVGRATLSPSPRKPHTSGG